MSAETAEIRPEEMPSGPAVAGDAIELGRGYQILPGSRLPQFDSPTARAFGVEDLRHPGRPLFALVCDRSMLPRLDAMKSLSLVESKSFIRPEFWRVQHWPPAGQERHVVVYEQPAGERVFATGAAEIEPLREDELSRKVIRPLIQALIELHGRQIPHRAIRADNLFFRDGERDAVSLGECVSEPAGFSQPAIYETVENGLAMRSGRGPGRLSDDIYALGVLLVVLLNGGDPWDGAADEDVVAMKMERGSYAALLSNVKVSLNLMEPLRGMLNDSAAQRWNVQDLYMWLDGRHQTPKQKVVPFKVPRAFSFCGQEHANLRALANAMVHSWPEATQAMQTDRFRDWLKHAAASKLPHGPMLEATVRSLQAWPSGDAAVNELVSRVLIVLDSEAPIRYRSFAAHIESLGQALAVNFHHQQTVQDFAEMVMARLPFAWLEAQPVSHPAFIQLKRDSELAEFFVRSDKWGHGVERCLYELCPGWPCQSPILKAYLVGEVTELLPALERIAADGPPEFDPVDRHIAAFCGAQLKKLADRALQMISAKDDPVSRRIGMLRLYANVQKATDAGPVPALAAWLARLMSPVLETFHNRPYRRSLAAALEEVSAEGDLMKLLNLVDNATARERDEIGFDQAKALFEQAGREIEWLQKGGLTSGAQVQRGGRQAAMLLSSVLSGIGLLALTVFYVT